MGASNSSLDDHDHDQDQVGRRGSVMDEKEKEKVKERGKRRGNSLSSPRNNISNNSDIHEGRDMNIVPNLSSSSLTMGYSDDFSKANDPFPFPFPSESSHFSSSASSNTVPITSQSHSSLHHLNPSKYLIKQQTPLSSLPDDETKMPSHPLASSSSSSSSSDWQRSSLYSDVPIDSSLLSHVENENNLYLLSVEKNEFHRYDEGNLYQQVTTTMYENVEEAIQYARDMTMSKENEENMWREYHYREEKDEKRKMGSFSSLSSSPSVINSETESQSQFNSHLLSTLISTSNTSDSISSSLSLPFMSLSPPSSVSSYSHSPSASSPYEILLSPLLSLVMCHLPLAAYLHSRTLNHHWYETSKSYHSYKYLHFTIYCNRIPTLLINHQKRRVEKEDIVSAQNISSSPSLLPQYLDRLYSFLPHLTTIELYQCHLSYSAISSLFSNPKLTSLYLNHFSLIETPTSDNDSEDPYIDVHGENIWEKLNEVGANLKVLKLRSTTFNDSDMMSLQKLLYPTCHSQREIPSNNPILKKCLLRHLDLSQCPQLRNDYLHWMNPKYKWIGVELGIFGGEGGRANAGEEEGMMENREEQEIYQNAQEINVEDDEDNHTNCRTVLLPHPPFPLLSPQFSSLHSISLSRIFPSGLSSLYHHSPFLTSLSLSDSRDINTSGIIILSKMSRLRVLRMGGWGADDMKSYVWEYFLGRKEEERRVGQGDKWRRDEEKKMREFNEKKRKEGEMRLRIKEMKRNLRKQNEQKNKNTSLENKMSDPQDSEKEFTDEDDNVNDEDYIPSYPPFSLSSPSPSSPSSLSSPLTSLTHLSLPHFNSINDILSYVAYFTELKELYISSIGNVFDEGILKLCRKHENTQSNHHHNNNNNNNLIPISSLSTLSIHRGHLLTDRSLHHISSSFSSTLTSLSLYISSITDNGVQDALSLCTELVEINLSESLLTDVGGGALFSGDKMRKLERIILQNCEGIYSGGIEKLVTNKGRGKGKEKHNEQKEEEIGSSMTQWQVGDAKGAMPMEREKERGKKKDKDDEVPITLPSLKIVDFSGCKNVLLNSDPHLKLLKKYLSSTYKIQFIMDSQNEKEK